MEVNLSQQIKVKHHFLPEVYLKGFSIEGSDELFVMNKKWGKISPKHPAQIMYEKHLYTIDGFGNPQMIEDFYSELENELSDAFELIEYLRKNAGAYRALKDSVEFHKLIKVVVAFQFWRAPAQNELAKNYADNLIELFSELSEQTKSTIDFDEQFIKYLHANRHIESHLKLIQHMVLPVVTFKVYDDSYIDFYFYVTNKDDGLVLTCDNPVVFDSLDDLFDFKRFMFPLSKNVVLGSGSIDSTFNISDFNAVIVKQASDRIVGASEWMLKKCSDTLGN